EKGNRPAATARPVPRSLSDADQFTASFRPFPALNFGCFDAAILIFSPVRGLRPSEAARFDTVKVPNPTRRTSSPFLRDEAIESKTASTAFVASDFFKFAADATASTSSFLFTSQPPYSKRWNWTSGRTAPRRECRSEESRASIAVPPRSPAFLRH